MYDTAVPGLRFRVLGPLEVRSGAQVVAVNATQLRAVLAVLVLSAGRDVARDVLIDQVWNGVPPDGAVKTLQSYVSRLRTGLGRELELVTGPGGRTYRLAAAPGAVDGEEFAESVERGRRALDDGDAGTAAAAFADALGRWRGAPLADLVGHYRFADEAARRLEALRAVAVEGAFRAAAAGGGLAGRVDQIDEAVRRYPDRAGLWQLLITGLCAAGRQGDALGAFDRYRRYRRDLGLDPEPTLAALHGRVLRQDPALLPGPAVPAAPDDRPGSVARLRAAALARLRAALAVAGTGQGRCVLVTGDAGMGKTALVTRLADEAVGAGWLVAYGSPHDAAGPTAFRPWVDVLDAIAATAGASGPDLHRVREALTGPAESRERQFGQVCRALRESAAGRPLLVVLDDLHQADGGSVKLLAHAARLLSGARILVVAVGRDAVGWPAGEAVPGDGPGGDAPRPAWLDVHDGLRRLPGTHTEWLGPLPTADVTELISDELGACPSPTLAAAVTARAAGNPLFAIELTRLLADNRELARLCESGRLPGVPLPVRQALRDRADRLPSACRDLLAFAAVLGTEFERSVLRTDAAGTPGDPRHADVDALLHLAATHRFVEEARTGVLRFRHPLTREVFYHDIAGHCRPELHARAATAIERTHAGQLDPYAEALAGHWAQVPGPDARDRAYAYTRIAGRRAAATLAWEEAARLVGRALELDDGADPIRTAELLLERGTMLARAGEPAEADRLFLDAVALSSPDPAAFARAVLAIGEETTYLSTRPQSAPRATALITQALDRLGDADPGLRARLLASLGEAVYWAAPECTPDASARRLAATTEAVELARCGGDLPTLARALRAHCNAIWRPDNPQERRRLDTELVGVAESLGDRGLALVGLRNRFAVALELGDTGQAEMDAAACGTIAARSRRVDELFWAAVLETTLALLRGRFPAAEAALGQVLESAAAWRGADRAEPHGGVTAQLLLFQRDAGRPPRLAVPVADADRALSAHRDQHPHLAQPWRLAAASHLLSQGLTGPARQLYQEAVVVGFDTIPRSDQWVASMLIAADLCARFDDPDTAADLLARLSPHAGGHAVVACGFGCLGSTDQAVGQLRAVLGDHAGARQHFDHAIRANRRLGAPPLVARAQLEYARAVLRAGGPGDRSQAETLLAAAASTATRIGADGLLRDIDACARAAGAALGAGRARHHDRTGHLARARAAGGQLVD